MRYAYAAVLAGFLMAPGFAAGQTDNEFRATIRQALLSDPRTQQMSDAELEEMVTLLAQEAADEGVTAEDITWRPQAVIAEEAAEAATCGMLCRINRAFGLDGSAPLIPILLGATSMALIVFLGYELEKHRAQRRESPPLA